MTKTFILALCLMTVCAGAALADAEAPMAEPQNCPSAETVRDGALPKGWKLNPIHDEHATIDRLGSVRVLIIGFKGGVHQIGCTYIKSDLSVAARAFYYTNSTSLESRIKAARYITEDASDNPQRDYLCLVDKNTDCRF